MTRRMLMLAAALGEFEKRVNFRLVERLVRVGPETVDACFVSGRSARLQGPLAAAIWAQAAKRPRFAGGTRNLVNLEFVEQISRRGPSTVDVLFTSGRDPRLQDDDALAVWAAAGDL